MIAIVGTTTAVIVLPMLTAAASIQPWVPTISCSNLLHLEQPSAVLPILELAGSLFQSLASAARDGSAWSVGALAPEQMPLRS